MSTDRITPHSPDLPRTPQWEPVNFIDRHERPNPWSERTDLLHANAALVDQNRLLEIQANTDQLTGFPNRRVYEQQIEAAIASGEPFAVAFIDLDDFKAVNDTYSHGAGDELLQATPQHAQTVFEREYQRLQPGEYDETSLVARGMPRLFQDISKPFRSTEQSSDRPADGIPCRTGGDEFGVVLRGWGLDADQEVEISNTESRMSDEISAGLQADFPNFDTAGVSVGIAVYRPGNTEADLHEAASLRMKKAKEGRKVTRAITQDVARRLRPHSNN